MTFTSFAPSRRELRQQSMAVLPTPMIKTRSPTLSMWECNGFEPGNPDMNAVGVVAAGQLELLALGCTRAHEHGIEFLRIEQFFHALDGGIQAQVGAHIHDIAYFLVEYVGRKPERSDV